MGESSATVPDQRNRSLIGGGDNTSFRLRCPSLNSVRLHRIFDIFDKNKDGTMTVEELGQALGRLGLSPDSPGLESTIRSFIVDGNEGLMFEDFAALHQSLDDAFFGMQGNEFSCNEEEYESDLSEAFKVFDEDGDGFISARELQVVLGKLGLQEGEEIDEVNRMISSVDRNHDGRIDFSEFKEMMTRTKVLVPSS